MWLALLLLGLCTPGLTATILPGFTLDFETGDLRGWTATGDAFRYQPTFGDNPTARNRGQRSNHQGNYWIGTYERYQGDPDATPGTIQGDKPTGLLTSPWFRPPADRISFLVGGGSGSGTAVELQVENAPRGRSVALSASGRNSETMRRVTWDLTPYRDDRVRLVIRDSASGAWGHINADDFRFEQAAETPAPRTVSVPDVRNQPLDRAERLLTAKKLHTQVAGTVPSAAPAGRVVDQEPKPGRSVNPGTTVNLILSESITLQATASTREPEVGQVVRFELRLTPAPEDTRKEFALLVEGVDNRLDWAFSAEPTRRLTRSFDRSGEFTVTPLARLDGERIVEGEPIRLRVAGEWMAPRASIGPAPTEVTRGTPLELRSTSRFDARNREPRLVWERDGRRICEGEVCRVENPDDDPGEHRVVLTVTDERDLRDRAVHVYRIIVSARPVLSIEPWRVKIPPDGKATLRALWRPEPPPSPRYEWQVDGELSGDGEHLTVSARSLAPGSHTVRLVARAGQREIFEAQTVLFVRERGSVVPPWIPPTTGAALLGLGLALMRRPGRTGGRSGAASVQAVAHRGGMPESRLEEVPPERTEVCLRLAVDCRGEQTIQPDDGPEKREPRP